MRHHVFKYFTCVARMLALSALGTMAAHAQPTSSAPLKAAVLDVVVVTEASHPQLNLKEISGIAWDADERRLYAVSDKARLYHLALELRGDKIGTITLSAVYQLVDRDGQPLPRHAINSEGIALTGATDGIPGNTELLIVSETPAAFFRFGPDGRMRAVLDLPLALRVPENLRSRNSGLESITVHPRLGFLTAPETPLASQDRAVHSLYGSDGAVISFASGIVGKTSIKALETLPAGDLLVLERQRSSDRRVTRSYLRLLNPDQCVAQSPCSPQAVHLDMGDLRDANFEGLAHLGDDRFLLASDDRVGGKHRTVIALISLRRTDKNLR